MGMFFQNLDKRDLFLVAFFSGLIFILCSLYFLFIIPTKPIVSNHSNLNSTIIALELIGNVEDYNNLLGVVDNTKYQFYSDSFLKSIDVDNFYIFIYSLYFLLLFEIGFRLNSFSRKIPFVFYTLLLFCILFDLSENYKISTILNAKSAEQLTESILNLRMISLCKWFIFFLISGFVGVLFWLSTESILLKIAGLFLFTAFVTSLPGLFRFSLIEIASYILSLGLLFSWIYIIQKNYHFLFLK